MRVAAIDIGTNTVLLLVAERGGPGVELMALEEQAMITRLGEGVDKTRVLAPAAVERTCAAIDRCADAVMRLGVTRIDVVGTSAMRDARGSEALRAHVKAKLGVDARTISGDEEARLTFAGALSGIAVPLKRPSTHEPSAARVRVFDIGGGSTEVVHGEWTGAPRADAVLYARSFDVGSVRLTERHITTDPPNDVELGAVRDAARAKFQDLPAFDSDLPPIGIAGTMTTIGAISLKMASYDPTRVHGLTLPVKDVERVVMELARLPLDRRRSVPGLEPKRADVIVAGGLVALAYLEQIGAQSVMISDRGVRWGLAEQLARAESE